MTKKLFYENMYMKEATANVVKIHDKIVFLDQTVFFPEGGGQVGDTGLINGFQVFDTQKQISKNTKTLFHNDFPVIQINTDVAHILSDEPINLKEGEKVKLEIDWNRRYETMKMHSAAHVVYHFSFKVLSDPIVKGCSINNEHSRFDFSLSDYKKINLDQLTEIESLSNEFISKNYDIVNEALRDEPEAIYWICNNIKIPCGGMHVKNTSEIGQIKLKRKSQGKKIDRLIILFS
ncbi:MAG: alanyl-tRNA editing protein [Proteobacteria bacterium]|nr:alanyl-tRNA editing protein [Pseudomonadota bacterium]MBU1585101.1 alanyl-tRNA editing protein [Pseudomonadota bacterium]MBU2627563.1 alanyl-tRNA editing protein [Pseudomonadota bacterium]